MTDDLGHYLSILVRADVTDWERKFCASLIRQRNTGKRFSDKQSATLRRIVEDFQRRNLRDDAPLIESGHADA